jgi:hypothetical protein
VILFDFRGEGICDMTALGKNRFIKAFAVVVLIVFSVGCGKGLEQTLVGKWKAKPNDKAASTKPEDQLTKAMAESMMSMFSLELKADKTFTMTMMIFPIEGKWSVSGSTLELKPEKMMGMTAEQVRSKDEKVEMKSEIMRFTVSPDGKELTPMEDKAKADKENMDMVFVKEEAK